ncbi:MAG: DNA polymerase III subunit alpha [Bacteroidota bacterium]
MYLNAHSYYSLRWGTLSPQQLVAAARARGVTTLALTDINNTSASFAFVQCCVAHGIRPVLGIEFRRDHQLLYIGLAKNNEGFFQLNRFLTEHSLAERPLPVMAPPFEDAYIIYPRLPKPVEHLSPNEYLGIRPEDLNTLLAAPRRFPADRLVAWSPITFVDKTGYHTHRILRAIDRNTLITKLTAADIAPLSEMFHSPDQLRQHYRVRPDLVRNAERLLASCSIEWSAGPQHNRQTFSGSEQDDFELLEKLAHNGCKIRYGERDHAARQRVALELQVIRKLGFCCYFLITWDIIRYAKEMNYAHVGRGSGANSIVAYCLHITDVEPIELALYFERFINQFRTSPPDFDIDFAWDERDDVIDYILKRYGTQYTALLATYSTFRGKSIVREVGKTFGLPKADLDLIIEQPEALQQHHGLAQQVLRYGQRLEGFPNYLSIHAGGILISQRPINYFTALRRMPKGFPIVHFDMYAAEEWGFHKYDVLSQRGLGHIKAAVALVAHNQRRTVNIHDLARIKRDSAVRQLLRSGRCMGCFYIESPAMRGLLHKLRCDNYVHLVAASSIIRPGVAQSGMMREYIKRFHDPSQVIYLHQVFEEQLHETFGIMVYQEDVMKVVHHFAGLELDESDVLRRIMSGKRSSSEQFARLRTKYFTNCRERGYSEQLTQEVWRQIESFSGYSFCKAHSASFAAESFQSLYLRAHYPREFMVAVINNFGGFYATEYYFHELQQLDATVHPPCVNRSLKLTTIYGKEVYVGFVHLHQLERQTMDRLLREREARGPFCSLEDFIRRVLLSAEQLDLLIRIDAFRFTGQDKYALMWEKNRLFHPRRKHHRTEELFDDEREVLALPQLEAGPHDDAFDQIELLGFSLGSPFELLPPSVREETVLASQLVAYAGKRVCLLGYFVTRKNIRTRGRKLMCFATWYDRRGQHFDTTHFAQSLQRHPLRGKGIYRIVGKVVLDFGFPSVEVTELEKLPLVRDERY